jgi:hypothetical protein
MTLQEKTSPFEKKENQFPRKTGKACERPSLRLFPRRRKPTLSCGPLHESRHPCPPQAVLKLILLHRVTGQKLHFESIEGKEIVYGCKEAPSLYLLCADQDRDQVDLKNRLYQHLHPADNTCQANSVQNPDQTPFFSPEERKLFSQMAKNPAIKADVLSLLEYAEKNKIKADYGEIIKAVITGHTCPD